MSGNKDLSNTKLEKCLNPTYLMLVLVFRIFKYCKMSGTVINLNALRNLETINYQGEVKSLYLDKKKCKTLDNVL